MNRFSTQTHPAWLPTPPFRERPESVRRIMVTQLACLLLPAAAATTFFGLQALWMLLAATTAAALAEILAGHARQVQTPGSIAHSILLGALSALILPVEAGPAAAAFAAILAVLLGKQLFGGLGHYVWHPALIGRIAIELFFHNKLPQNAGHLLARNHLFWGHLPATNDAAANVTSWLRFDWFAATLPDPTHAFRLPCPADVLRHLDLAQFQNTPNPLAHALTDRLPSLQHLLWGAVPGHLGETCAAAILLVGLYFIYRGYLRWLLPVAFLAAAVLTAALTPLTGLHGSLLWPVSPHHPAVSLTYLSYHLFAGSMLFAPFLLLADSTARPISAKGQLLFGLAAGALAMTLRLRSNLPVPAFVAILVLQSFTWLIDRYTRPRPR